MKGFRGLAWVLIVCLSVSALAGCNMNRGGGTTDDGTMMEQRTMDRSRNYNDTRNRDMFGANRNDMRQYNEGQGMNQPQQMDTSEKAAQQIAKMDHVDAASVLLTDQNAYVAVMLKHAHGNGNGQDMTDSMKERIAKQVKKVEPNVQNVYVTENPDFLGRLQSYGDAVREGRPIEGIVQELTEMVERVFPQSS